MPKKTTKKKSRVVPRSQKPLEWRALAHWFEQACEVHEWKKARVDRRLFTIAPSIQGVLEGMIGYTNHPPSAHRVEVLRLAKRALGTYDNPVESWRNDRFRVDVVADWMFRCALPLWLERLPRRLLSCVESGQTFREMKPLVYVRRTISALAPLDEVWDMLEHCDRGVEHEGQIIAQVHEKVGLAIYLLAKIVPRGLRPFVTWQVLGDELDATLCRGAMELLWTTKPQPHHDPAIKETIPALLNVLRAVQLMDSQESIAARCVWPAPRSATKKGKRAA